MTPPLLSRQQAVSMIEAQAQINIWEGAIRSGKTIASLARWLTHIGQMRKQTGEIFCFGRTRDAVARNVFSPLTTVPLLRAMAPGTSYTSGAATARIAGQVVHVFGANDKQAEEKLRGITGKSAYGDELTVLPAAFFRQATGRLSVLDAALFGTTNPDNPNHWLKVDYLDRPRTQGKYQPADDDETTLDLATWHFELDDNPYLSPRYIRDRKAEYTGLWYQRMIEGLWVQAEGAIYESWDPARHVVDELPRIDRVLSVGVDYGTTNPFAAVTLALSTDGRLVVTREYRHDSKAARRSLTDAEYSAAVREWIAEGSAPLLIAVDPSAASFHEQLFRDRVRGVTDADNAVLDGIRLVASLLAAGRLVVHRSCKGLIGEIPGYTWDDKAQAKGEDRPIKANDHSVDALRYAITTSQHLWRRAVPLTPWQPPG